MKYHFGQHASHRFLLPRFALREDSLITNRSILDASRLIQGKVHRTPVLTSVKLNQLAGCNLYFKCENFQKTGAFKARGALNSVLRLPEDVTAVITHSSGNHGAALAWAASQRGLKCHVVCPENASPFKLKAIERYGGEIIPCGPALEERERATAGFLETHRAEFIHPYDADSIIAGQATVALEVLDQVPELEQLWVPIGGGGLISGCILAASGELEVIGAEPELAGEAFESLRSGTRLPPYPPKSIADGLLAGIGVRNFEILRENRTKVCLVSDEQITQAMRLIWQIMKIVVEPSAAVPLAAVLDQKGLVEGRHVGIVISGGNVQFEGSSLA